MGQSGAHRPIVVTKRGNARGAKGVGHSRRLLGRRLDHARTRAPRARFVKQNIVDWAPTEPPNLIFANGALDFLSDHHALLRGQRSPDCASGDMPRPANGSALRSPSTGSRAPLPGAEIAWPSRPRQSTAAVTPNLRRSGRRDQHGAHGSQIRAGSGAVSERSLLCNGSLSSGSGRNGRVAPDHGHTRPPSIGDPIEDLSRRRRKTSLPMFAQIATRPPGLLATAMAR